MKGVIKLPLATRHEDKSFSISKRSGRWKLYKGNCRPPQIVRTAHHTVAKYFTASGQRRVREFIRIRNFQSINDSEIMNMIRSGRINVDDHLGEIWSNGQKLQPEITRTGYQCVRLYIGADKRRKISVHKLVIMNDIDDVIPEGFDIDHRDQNPLNNSIQNLRLRNSVTNRTTNLQPLTEGEF